jgi:hypothetical protein
VIIQRPDSDAAVGIGVRHHQHTAAVGEPPAKCLDAIAQVQDFAVSLAVDVDQPDLPPGGMPVAARVKNVLAILAQKWPGASLWATGQHDAFAGFEIVAVDPGGSDFFPLYNLFTACWFFSLSK